VSAGAPVARGRTWTPADYALRDARLQALGVASLRATDVGTLPLAQEAQDRSGLRVREDAGGWERLPMLLARGDEPF
jgi:hypothetical protein